MPRIINIQQNTDEWLAWRHDGITATDASAIWGTSPWRSRLDVFADKTGPCPKETTGSAKMEWGHRIEPLLIEKWSELHHALPPTCHPGILYEERGVVANRLNDTSVDEYWQKASLDCEVEFDDGHRAIVECKTGSSHDEWFDEDGNPSVPSFYNSQVQWQMRVSGIRETYFSVLIGGSEWFERHVYYDQEFSDKLYTKCLETWEAVKEGVAPNWDGNHNTNDLKVAAALYAKKPTLDTLELDDDSIIKEYTNLSKTADAANEALNACKAKVMQRLGNHKALTFEGKKFASIITRKGGMKLDPKKIEAADPELYKKCLVETRGSSYLSVKKL